MPLFQVSCNTILVVEAEDGFKAVSKFMDSETKGGFHYTVEEVQQTEDEEYAVH